MNRVHCNVLSRGRNVENKHFYRFTLCKPNRSPAFTKYKRKLEPWEYELPWWVAPYLVVIVIFICW